MIKFKKGFTLAEVLVTLGIVGVVAALTIPSLVNNNQRRVLTTQLRKISTELNLALLKYMSDQRVESLAETKLAGNILGLEEFVDNYLKVDKVTVVGQDGIAFANTYYTIDGNKSANPITYCNYQVRLKSGAGLCLDSQKVNHPESSDPDAPHGPKTPGWLGTDGVTVINVIVDVNGPQGPNVFGRDLFQMQVNRNGDLFDRHSEANGDSNGNAVVDIDTSTPSVNIGFYGKIVYEGWVMNY